MSTYNGWKNHDTWNVALWIGNDEPLYRSAVSFMRAYRGRTPYADFIESLGAIAARTPDGTAWLSRALDRRALNSFMRELAS